MCVAEGHHRAGEVYLTNAEPWAYDVYDSGSVTATANPHHGPYTAILYGEDSGVPVDRIATDAVGGHPSWFTRYDLGGALLYVPHGELVLVGHDLVLRPAVR